MRWLLQSLRVGAFGDSSRVRSKLLPEEAKLRQGVGRELGGRGEVMVGAT